MIVYILMLLLAVFMGAFGWLLFSDQQNKLLTTDIICVFTVIDV